ncbi:MAG: signal peptidase I [Planctomycetota bacterium]|nr:signal peptidase I [Planctomycetota bacterium]
MSWKSLRENIEAITVAILLALIIRHFIFESYEIPTGSMAPGLNGLHVTVPCPNCETDNNVGIQSDSLTNKIRMGNRIEIFEGLCSETNKPIEVPTQGKNRIQCPSCGQVHPTSTGTLKREPAISMRAWCKECTYRFPVIVKFGDVLNGNKILVDKMGYNWTEPERWDVVVFRFNRERNYIKRLVGLPGEKIKIAHGDVHINGSIQAKPLSVQEHFWITIHDSAVEERGQVEAAWNASPGWVRKDSGWDFNLIQDEGELKYVRGVDNKYNYNPLRGSSHRINSPVRDLSIRTELRASPEPGKSEARLSIGIQNFPSDYRWSFPFSSGSAVLELIRSGEDPVLLTSVDGLALTPDQQYRIEAQIVDRTARLIVDDKLVSEISLPDSEIDSGTRLGTQIALASSVSIGAKQCGGTIEQLQLFRDQHWTLDGNYAISSEYQIEADRYFVMGDNSPSSLDSRYWGSFARSNLLGRGFVIFWPALPGRNEIGFIR